MRRRAHHAQTITGATLVEVLVALAILGSFLIGLSTVLGSGVRGSARATDSADAVRAAMLAMEAIRLDTRRIIWQTPKDLSIAPDGHGLSFLIPGAASETDAWSFSGIAVSWKIAPVAGHNGTYQLVRTASDGRSAPKGCFLGDLSVRFVPAGKLAAGAFLDITLIGLAAPGSSATHTVSFLTPLRVGAS